MSRSAPKKPARKASKPKAKQGAKSAPPKPRARQRAEKAAEAARPERQRPTPPDSYSFTPAPEVRAWIESQLLAEDGPLYNPDHKHLRFADFEVLWAPGGFKTKGRTVIGTAEEVTFRCNKWQKLRQEQQMYQWFGRVPDYLITLDAEYCRECSDAEWCALVEHELYHVAHKIDEFGAPAFTRDGAPKLEIRGHDVEEFIGVVRRYGVGNHEGMLSRLVEAANARPEVSRVSLAGACGTCLLRVA